jgi:Tol biopolymer transport system component
MVLSLSCSRTTSVKATKKRVVPKTAKVIKVQGPNKIFFLSARDGSDQIYSINPDGTGLKKITDESDGILKQGFDVSKDGTKIVFYGPRGDYSAQPEINAVNTDGSALKTLGNGQDALWSPDGRRLVLLGTNEFDSITPIIIMNEDGTNRRQLADDGFAPLWSSTGYKIAYLHLLDIKDSSRTARVINLSGQLVFDFGVCYPDNFGWTFSPDDTSLAYYTQENKGLKIGDLKNGKSTTIITENVNTGPPVWSPDGSTVYYQLFAVEPSNSENEGLWLYDVKSGKNRRLMNWYSSYSRIFSWSPDGSAIAISGDPNPPVSTDKAMPNPSNVWALSKQGVLKQITDSGQDYSPIWR